MDERKDARTHGRTDGQTDGRTDGRTWATLNALPHSTNSGGIIIKKSKKIFMFHLWFLVKIMILYKNYL